MFFFMLYLFRHQGKPVGKDVFRGGRGPLLETVKGPIYGNLGRDRQYTLTQKRT